MSSKRKRARSPAAKPAGAPAAVSNSHSTLITFVLPALGLAIAAAWVFAAVVHFGFVDFDDPVMVTENPHVTAGLTATNVAWAFTHFQAGYWIPAVWISYMLEISLFGVNAGALHTTNVAIHIVNAILLFALLERTTGATARSWLVAAVFAVHPLHVESVAWITERKDVLSTFFWLSALHVYVSWTRSRTAGRYAAILLLFIGGLMAKPMAVTLPATLLLVDIWPLRRITWSEASAWNTRWRDLWPLVREKIPFAAVSIIFSAVAVVTQQGAGAMNGWVPWYDRLGNAALGYVTYLFRSVWPMRLVLLYPYPAPHLVPALAAGIALLVATAAAIWIAPRRPYVLMGWLWYLVTLVPVIGFVQVGIQPTADRFTYVPLIGIAVLAVWSLADAVPDRRALQRSAVAGAAVVLVACAFVARAQAATWETTLGLWQHAIDVMPDNYLAQYQYGQLMLQQRRPDEAVKHLSLVVDALPDFADGHLSLGVALQQEDKRPDAIAELHTAIRLNPSAAEAHLALGMLLASSNQLDEAAPELTEAIRLDPDHAVEAQQNLGIVLALQNRPAEAIPHFQEAIRLSPDYEPARFNLAVAFANTGRRQQAIDELEALLRVNPNHQDALNLLKSLRGGVH